MDSYTRMLQMNHVLLFCSLLRNVCSFSLSLDLYNLYVFQVTWCSQGIFISYARICTWIALHLEKNKQLLEVTSHGLRWQDPGED